MKPVLFLLFSIAAWLAAWGAAHAAYRSDGVLAFFYSAVCMVAFVFAAFLTAGMLLEVLSGKR